MARIQAYNDGFSFGDSGLHRIPYDGNTFVREPGRFGARYLDESSIIHKGFDLLYGSFTYGDKIAPSSGTVTRYDHSFSGGRLDFRITGLSIDIKEFTKVILTDTKSDDVALLRSALSGDDVMIGGAFGDSFSGYAGNDLIIGRGGRDIVSGGAGDDTFRFGKVSDSAPDCRDTIKDFKRGEDKIDLYRIDADQDGTAGNQAFKFIGGKAFTGRDGELRFSGGSVYGDVNGDKVADFAIKVAGLKALAASDFVL
jgi:Ca2+-binding RTX toxin-like protein